MLRPDGEQMESLPRHPLESRWRADGEQGPSYRNAAQDQNQRRAPAEREPDSIRQAAAAENIKQEEEQSKLLHYTKPAPVITPTPHQNQDYLLLENIKQEMAENIKQWKEQAKKFAGYQPGKLEQEAQAEKLEQEAQVNRAEALKDRIQELQDLMDQKENLMDQMDQMDLKELKDLMSDNEYARVADKDDHHEKTEREKGKETKRGSATVVPMGSTKAPLPSRLIRQALTLIRNIIRNVNARENSYKEAEFPGGGFPAGTPATSNASYNSSYCSEEPEDGFISTKQRIVNTEQRENVRQMVKDPEQRKLWKEEMKEMKRCQKDNNDKISSWFDDNDRENSGRKLGFPEEEPARLSTANLKTKGNSSDRDEAQTTQEDQIHAPPDYGPCHPFKALSSLQEK
jgi:hypothetical protein